MLTAEIHPDGIATLQLDQPERRNALSIAMRDAISDTLEAWTTDERVRVVVLTAAGSTFCAGFDLKEFAKPELARSIRDSSHRYHLMGLDQRVLDGNLGLEREADHRAADR
jgi:enoyl-CoA hydratase/carnithine racemase